MAADRPRGRPVGAFHCRRPGHPAARLPCRETKADLTRWVVGAGILQTSLIIGVLLKVAKLL